MFLWSQWISVSYLSKNSLWFYEQVDPLTPNSTNLYLLSHLKSWSIDLKGEPEWDLFSFKGLTSKWESILITAIESPFKDY